MESKNGDDEEILFESTGTAEDNKFDEIVGKIEEILLGEDFASVQNNFCRSHCNKFHNDEENRPEYMELFNSYVTLMESTIDSMLSSQIPGFNMTQFESMLVERQDEISGEIFDLLSSMGDFNEFKDLMLNYKREQNKSGKNELSLSGKHIS
mmetsp:Transcript_24550/g.22303  ORF Transcript_24550/g.22303 Transcript_24550/m.22303 type:complete len:152 (-) Transcript_24550:89-544(-)